MEKDTCTSSQHVLPSKQTLSKNIEKWKYFQKKCHLFWPLPQNMANDKSEQGAVNAQSCQSFLPNMQRHLLIKNIQIDMLNLQLCRGSYIGRRPLFLCHLLIAFRYTGIRKFAKKKFSDIVIFVSLFGPVIRLHTLRCLIKGYTRLFNFRNFDTLPSLLRVYPLIKF